MSGDTAGLSVIPQGRRHHRCSPRMHKLTQSNLRKFIQEHETETQLTQFQVHLSLSGFDKAAEDFLKTQVFFFFAVFLKTHPSYQVTTQVQ